MHQNTFPNPSNEGKCLCDEVIIIITILFIYFIFPFVMAFSDALSLRVNLEFRKSRLSKTSKGGPVIYTKGF